MTNHQASVPKVVADYFGISTHPDIDLHPLVVSMFVPGRGWVNQTFRKRVSPSWASKLRREHGATVLGVGYRDQQGRVVREADFRISECVL